jgi:hypothetical protein
MVLVGRRCRIAARLDPQAFDTDELDAARPLEPPHRRPREARIQRHRQRRVQRDHVVVHRLDHPLPGEIERPGLPVQPGPTPARRKAIHAHRGDPLAGARVLDDDVVAAGDAVAGRHPRPPPAAGHVVVEDRLPVGVGRGRIRPSDHDHGPTIHGGRPQDRRPLTVAAPPAQHDSAGGDPNRLLELVGAGLQKHGPAKAVRPPRLPRHVIDRPLDLDGIVAVDRRDDDQRRHHGRLHSAAHERGVRVVRHSIAASGRLVDQSAIRPDVHVALRKVGGRRHRHPDVDDHDEPEPGGSVTVHGTVTGAPASSSR